MTHSLVICLLLALMTAIVAAAAALIAGWGWLAALAVYSLTGSVSLLAAAVAMRARDHKPAPAAMPRAAKDEPAFA
jgi:hypothetical protein